MLDEYHVQLRLRRRLRRPRGRDIISSRHADGLGYRTVAIVDCPINLSQRQKRRRTPKNTWGKHQEHRRTESAHLRRLKTDSTSSCSILNLRHHDRTKLLISLIFITHILQNFKYVFDNFTIYRLTFMNVIKRVVTIYFV